MGGNDKHDCAVGAAARVLGIDTVDKAAMEQLADDLGYRENSGTMISGILEVLKEGGKAYEYEKVAAGTPAGSLPENSILLLEESGHMLNAVVLENGAGCEYKDGGYKILSWEDIQNAWGGAVLLPAEDNVPCGVEAAYEYLLAQGEDVDLQEVKGSFEAKGYISKSGSVSMSGIEDVLSLEYGESVYTEYFSDKSKIKEGMIVNLDMDGNGDDDHWEYMSNSGDIAEYGRYWTGNALVPVEMGLHNGGALILSEKAKEEIDGEWIRSGDWTKLHAAVISEKGDTTAELAELMTGNKDDSALLSGVGAGYLEAGVEVSVLPLIEAFEADIRANIVDSADQFNAVFPDYGESFIHSINGLGEGKINDFFDYNKDVQTCDCLGAAKIIMVHGLVSSLKEGEYDRLGIGKDSLFVTSPISRISDLEVGDWGYFKNDQNYLAEHPKGGYQGENIIQVGDDRYYGFPGGVKNYADWKEELIWAYNSGLPAEKQIDSIPGVYQYSWFFDVPGISMKVFDLRKEDMFTSLDDNWDAAKVDGFFHSLSYLDKQMPTAEQRQELKNVKEELGITRAWAITMQIVKTGNLGDEYKDFTAIEDHGLLYVADTALGNLKEVVKHEYLQDGYTL